MEYSIIKKGRRGYVRPLPPLPLGKFLEGRFSYEKQGIEFMPVRAWGYVKLYSIKAGSFPWGLIDEVLEVCQLWSTTHPEDTFKVKVLKRLEIVPKLDPRLRPYQKEAVQAVISNHGGILAMPTGSGKTFTCLDVLTEKALVICPTKYLVEQWQEQVPDFVDVRTYQGIKDYKILKDYKIVVFDECHHVAASTLYKIAMKLDEQMVIGLSATPDKREDGEDLKVYGALGKIIYTISLRSLITSGYLCDAEIDIVELEHMEWDNISNYQEIYKDYIVDNNERNDQIIGKCEEYHGKKILILVNQIEHGEMLNDMLKPLNSIFLCSKTKKKSFEEDIIIATSILDEGIDLPDREVVILAGGGKSSIKVLQRIGRVLRTHPSKQMATIVDFKDSAKYLFKHYKRRMEIYEEHGFKYR